MEKLIYLVAHVGEVEKDQKVMEKTKELYHVILVTEEDLINAQVVQMALILVAPVMVMVK